jgi:ABC-type nitrate/sulfonate/bicarbonate transport system ATPase subunit
MNTNIPISGGDAATPATAPTPTPASPQRLTRDEVLGRPAEERLSWFSSITYVHPHLLRTVAHLQELMEPGNDIKVIALIGPTGIGKTTLIDKCLLSLVQRFAPVRLPHEVPVAMIAAPSNGERSVSWKTIYRRMQMACGGILLDQQRKAEVTDAELAAVRVDRVGLAQRREFLEAEVRHRRVRLLGIDESHHLLRFGSSDAMMDTLKSLADIQAETKLMLVGTYQIAPLLTTYGQLARRSAILHYKRYHLSAQPKDDSPTEDEAAFREVLRKVEEDWPCEAVPNLQAAWKFVMRSSLGSVGLMKMQVTQLASLQMGHKRERVRKLDVECAFKAPKMLNQIEAEMVDGEESLRGACYGEADLSDPDSVALWTPTREKRRA